ncbi:MAG: AmmeMemoRadiSam system protein B [Thermoplasmata archaeon]
MVRKPAVAGQFYPGRESELRKKIEWCFKHKSGPGSLPKEIGSDRELKGLVVPHAGYEYSGPVAAHSYAELYEDGHPDVAVLIGPAHGGLGAGGASVGDQDFKTPLGVAEADSGLTQEIARGPIRLDNRAHRGEHSLEVQIPFLQYLFQDIKIVPVLINKQDFDTPTQVGKILGEAIEEKNAVVIASTDFSHYVTAEVAKKKDKLAIDPIVRNEPEELYNAVRKNNISMCGYGPVISMMVATGYRKGTLLKYGTSGDVSPMRDVVGYAAICCR